jgi:EmrB/QacA subfamily drug resistance transporter
MEMSDTPVHQKMSVKDLLIVIVVALGSFMAGLDATIVNIALPSISKSLDITTVTSSWVLNAYLIILVSLLLAASRLGDIRGYTKLFLGGFALFTLGSALCGLSSTIGVLIISRMIQAVGGAAIAALGAVMVTSYLPSSVRGQALGIVAMFTMLGAALGPVIGGFLTSVYSWPFIFYVNVPVGIIAILLGMRILPSKPPVSPNAKLDIPGVGLVFVALSTLIFGLTTIQGAAPAMGGIAIMLSVIFWLLFFARERHAKEPLIDLKLFSNRAYTLQNFDILLIQMAMAGVMVLMPFYLEMVKGVTTGNSGAILLALPIGMILTAPISGKISDVIGTKKPIIFGFIIAAVSLWLLSTLSPESSIGHVSIYLFLLGAGTGVAYSPLNSAVMGESPVQDRGATSGLLKMMTNLGSSLGVAMAMLVSTAALGPLAKVSAHTLPVKDLAGAFDAAFFFLMAAEVLGIVLIIMVREKESSTSSDEAPMVGF